MFPGYPEHRPEAMKGGADPDPQVVSPPPPSASSEDREG